MSYMFYCAFECFGRIRGSLHIARRFNPIASSHSRIGEWPCSRRYQTETERQHTPPGKNKETNPGTHLYDAPSRPTKVLN